MKTFIKPLSKTAVSALTACGGCAAIACRVLLAATLAACGGGGGGGGSGTSITSSQLIGTAATGAPLANAPVVIHDAAGNSPCTESSITTTELGSYTCTLKVGESAPFFIKITDPTGNTAPLVSIAMSTPSAGMQLTINATPLTTAIIAQLNNGDALGVFNGRAVDANALAAATSNIVAQLATVLISINAPDGYNPFSTSITAATAGQTGNTADLVLDIVKITTTSTGELALSTITDPTPVPLASATSTGMVLAGPGTDVSDLSQATRLAAAAFNTCFALPVSTRVTLDNSNSITSVATECQNIVTTEGAPIGAPAFKHNGYAANRLFYSMLTSASMTGAKFSVPEIMAFYPLDVNNMRDRAVLNIRYLDNLGHAGNQITMAQNFPGSSSTAHPSNWWLTGNQKNFDIGITPAVWKNQNFNANSTSHFRNALRVWIEARSWAPQNGAVTSVRVTGPGYPTLGLWYSRTNYASGFVMAKERSASVPGMFTDACASCISYWISQTQGLSGTGASTYRANSTSLNWAQGTTEGSYNGQNGATVARPKKGDIYTFRIYADGTLLATEERTLLNDLVEVTQLVKLPWNDIGPQSIAALDPLNSSLNGAQNSLAIDWIQNPAAEFIRSVFISQTDGGSDNTSQFSLGATGVTATPANGSTYTALTGPVINGPATYSGFREIGFTYRMLDGSSKTAAYQYRP